MFFKSFTAVAVMLASAILSAEVVVKSGDKIGFLGDSITVYGNRFNGGYVNLVIAGLHANGIKAGKIPAGVSGNKSNQMLKRVDKDIISKKADIMLLSCGVNDVWHGKRGVKLEDYRKNITAIVDKAQAAGLKVCIITATMITENPKQKNNITLAGYNQFLRQLASQKKCMLADANADMQRKIADFQKSNPGHRGLLLTVDGIHMNALGDVVMAESVLRALGMNETQLVRARTAWRGKKVHLGRVMFTAETIEKLAKKAAAKRMAIPQYLEFIAEQ